MPSSVIHHFNYDPDTEVLRVTFLSGTVYEYKTVPKNIYEKMRGSFSKGRFLNKYIKGKFSFEKK
jgi:hypothetical protein